MVAFESNPLPSHGVLPPYTHLMILPGKKMLDLRATKSLAQPERAISNPACHLLVTNEVVIVWFKISPVQLKRVSAVALHNVGGVESSYNRSLSQPN